MAKSTANIPWTRNLQLFWKSKKHRNLKEARYRLKSIMKCLNSINGEHKIQSIRLHKNIENNGFADGNKIYLDSFFLHIFHIGMLLLLMITSCFYFVTLTDLVNIYVLICQPCVIMPYGLRNNVPKR